MPNQKPAELDLYEYQLNAVDDLLSFQPDFIDVLAPDEREVFTRYFLPDWDSVADFRVYHKDILREDPGMQDRALMLLKKFLAAHCIDPGPMLGPGRS